MQIITVNKYYGTLVCTNYKDYFVKKLKGHSY